MNCENQASPLWDSKHDWILQFDNVLKNRDTLRNIDCTHNSRVEGQGVYMTAVYYTPNRHSTGKNLRNISES